jgi:hypothetical protein
MSFWSSGELLTFHGCADQQMAAGDVRRTDNSQRIGRNVGASNFPDGRDAALMAGGDHRKGDRSTAGRAPAAPTGRFGCFPALVAQREIAIGPAEVVRNIAATLVTTMTPTCR